MHDSGQYSVRRSPWKRANVLIALQWHGALWSFAIAWQIVQGVDGAYACIPSVLRSTRFPAIAFFILPSCEERPDPSNISQVPSFSSILME